MPDPVTHYWFGKRVLSELDKEVRDAVNTGVYGRALQGPDPWSTIGFYGGKNKKYACRSSLMHKENTGKYFVELTALAKENSTVFSVLAGNICHYCLDKKLHPYIIYKGGAVAGAELTRTNRNGHVRLERAIDGYIIRGFYGKTPWKFDVSKELFKLKIYPEELREPLNTAFFKVYGWKNGFDSFNKALKDEALFYSIMQDPLGVIKVLLKPLSFGGRDYCAYSYYKCDIDQYDYLNECKTVWRNPFDAAISSVESVMEMFDMAINDSKAMISAAYNVVFKGANTELERIYGNFNYSTGLDCDDLRNL